MITPLSAALLSSLEDTPDFVESDGSEMEKKSPFPSRLGQASFRAGDFTGALKHLKQIKEEALTPADRYAMARCLEETGQPERALETTEKLMSVTKTTDQFWHDRATSLQTMLRIVLGQEPLQKEGTNG